MLIAESIIGENEKIRQAIVGIKRPQSQGRIALQSADPRAQSS